MSGYEVGLLVHLLGAFAFASGAVLAATGFEAARRRRRPAEIALLLGLTRIGALLVAGGGLVLLAAGIWLADRIGELGSGWVSASLSLFVLSVGLGALGGRKPKRARRLATGLGERTDGAGDELRELLDDRVSRIANYASSALVLAIVVLMVWQPGR